MRAKQCLCFNSNRFYGQDLVPLKLHSKPPHMASAAVRGGSVACDLLFDVPPNV